MQKSSAQTKLEVLINQLEEEIHKLTSTDAVDLGDIDDNTIDIETLKERFEQCITLVDRNYRSRISNLEMEINYLKELNVAQRLMMEDSLGYIKNLEEKLSVLRAAD